MIEDGVVVLAAVIQANSLLYKPGAEDLPGELLISLDPAIEPKTLVAIAENIHALKGVKCPDRERAAIADYLANELIRVFGLPIPLEISGGIPCCCSSTIFRRRSIPCGWLSRKLIPTLVHPTSLVAMLLPHEYWSVEGRNQYFQRA